MAHYGTLAEANAYHAARGNAGWTGTDEQKTTALVRASQYLDAVYGARWPGSVTDPAQELDWPRSGVTWRGTAVDSAEVPLPVQHAAYEAGLRELATPDSLNPDFDPSERVTSYTEQVGPLMERRDFAAPMSAAGARVKIPAIDGILRSLLTAGGAMNFQVTRV